MAQSTSNTSSRRHPREHDTVSIGSSRVTDTEWEANEVSPASKPGSKKNMHLHKICCNEQ